MEAKEDGPINDEIEITTKSELFKIKVTGIVVSPEKYEEQNNESLRVMNRPLNLVHVSEVIKKPKTTAIAATDQKEASVQLNPEKTIEEMAKPNEDDQ